MTRVATCELFSVAVTETSYMVAQRPKRKCSKRWQVEASSVLRPELGNCYSITSAVFYIVTELPRLKGREYRPHFSIGKGLKNLWPSLLHCSIKEETGEQKAAVY